MVFVYFCFMEAEMFRQKNLFRNPMFNVAVTLAVVIILALFYKVAISNYNRSLKDNLETLDTSILNSSQSGIPKTADDVLEKIGDVESARIIDSDLLEYCGEEYGEEIYSRLFRYLEENEYSDNMWKEVCGTSLLALFDLANGNADDYNYTVIESGNKASVVFAGDVSLDSNWNWSPVNVHKRNLDNLVNSAFSSELAEQMIGADLFCINLESPVTSSGTKLAGQSYHQRAAVENVGILGLIGADMVNLANDRIYDYSAAGLKDTIFNLDSAGVAYIGAGSTLEDAKTPRYLIAGGRKIAFVSALRAATKTTAPEASNTGAGLLYSTNSAYFEETIADARENADYVVVYTDWGLGNNAVADETQVSLAHSFVDAGADIVIGCRSTVMQNVEYYEGKPIFYGLGNFWYETDRHEALLVKLEFTCDVAEPEADTEENTSAVPSELYVFDEEPVIYCMPCVQENASVRLSLGTDEGNGIYTKLLGISGGVSISDEGIVTPAD